MPNLFRKGRVVVTLTTMLAMIAACGGSSGGDTGSSGGATPPSSAANTPAASSASSTSGDLEAAAKKDGSLLFYASVTETSAKALAAAFGEKYGIDTQVLRITSAQLADRFSAEAAAGAPAADAVLISRTGFTTEATGKGYLVPLSEAGIPGYPGDLPKQFIKNDEGTAVVMVQAAGIGYNTDLVKGADIPKSWDDLLDPKWKGKIGVADPKSSASYVAEWNTVATGVGSDFLSKIGAQDLKSYASGAPAAQALAAGEIAFNPMTLSSLVKEPKSKGAPVDIVVPELTSGAEVVLGIAAKAKHPNAARLFAQYALSQEGAKVLADAAGEISPYDTAKLPKDYHSPDLATALPMTDDILAKMGLS
jgi:iron(III) transport system substrate-binding protein